MFLLDRLRAVVAATDPLPGDLRRNAHTAFVLATLERAAGGHAWARTGAPVIERPDA